jgi:nicotinic acid phosphoribosyltransferase
MYDKYHLTTIETLKKLSNDSYRCVFELFFRKPGPENDPNEEFYLTKEFANRVRRVIKRVGEFYGKPIPVESIKVAGLPDKDIIEISPRFPIVQIVGGPEAILYESALINHVQQELIYTTRLVRVKKLCEKLGIKGIADFGLRRAPSIEAANLFSEIAIELGMKTSNMNLCNEYPEKVVGTLPHAFVQMVTYGVPEQEYKMWLKLLELHKVDSSIPDTILPDTYDFEKTLGNIFKHINKTQPLKIRIDSGDFIERLKTIQKLVDTFQYKGNLTVILSGDINESSLDSLHRRGLKGLVRQFPVKLDVLVAIGTQVVHNIKPLSITYKLVEVNGRPVTKTGAKGKSYVAGPTHVLKIENGYLLNNGMLPVDYPYTYTY